MEVEETAVEAPVEPAQVALPRPRAYRPRIYTLAALRSLDDVAHTGGLLGVRIPLIGAVFLEPQVGFGLGTDHQAYLAQVGLTLDLSGEGTWGWFFTAGYGGYRESASGSGAARARNAFGPTAGGGIRWLPGGIGFQLGATVSRVSFKGDQSSGPFMATVAHAHFGLVVAR